MAGAESRKRPKWGRWLLLALVVLYFAPVIPVPWQVWDCGPGWQGGLNVEGGGEEGCEPREGREWVSPSAIPAGVLVRAVVAPARGTDQSYELFSDEEAERRASQARIGLFFARISTFRTGATNRRMQRERAFLLQHEGEFERASRLFETLALDPRYGVRGDFLTRSDFFYARRNALLASDLERVWALTEAGLNAFHIEDGEGRFRWLIESARTATDEGHFERAQGYIDRARQALGEFETDLLAADDPDKAEDQPHRRYLFSEALTVQAELELARYEADPDPALAEAALESFEQAADIGNYTLTHQGAIYALSYLGRCEEADAVIDQSLAADELADAEGGYDTQCWEPEGGVRIETWIRQVRRCRLLLLGNREGAAEACAEMEAMVERGCRDDFGYTDQGLMRLPEPLPEPLACFASEDGPDQDGAADQADRG
jgi:hypothetical protein